MLRSTVINKTDRVSWTVAEYWNYAHVVVRVIHMYVYLTLIDIREANITNVSSAYMKMYNSDLNICAGYDGIFLIKKTWRKIEKIYNNKKCEWMK